MAAASQTVVCVLLTWLASLLAGTRAEVCSYTNYAYNEYDGRNELMISFKSCQWGCCWKFQTDPCCSPPVGLIVGCVFGGFFCLVLLVAMCCCCCYNAQRRQRSARASGGGRVVRYPPHRHHLPGAGGNAHFSPTGTSDQEMNVPMSTISTSIPPGVYQPPPSYEEVMAGEINPAYKPDYCPPPPPSSSPPPPPPPSPPRSPPPPPPPPQ